MEVGKMSDLLKQCQDMEKDLDYLDVCFSIIDKLLLHAARYKGVNAIAIKEFPGSNDICRVSYTTKEDAFNLGNSGLRCNECLRTIDNKILTLENTAEHYRRLGFYTDTQYIEYGRGVIGTTVISWDV